MASRSNGQYPCLGEAGSRLFTLNVYNDELNYRREHNGQPLTHKDLSDDVLKGFIAHYAREAAAILSKRYPPKASATEGGTEVNEHD